MKRLKTFLIYALLIAGFWIVSDLIIYLVINGTYQPVKTEAYISSPQVTIGESKATYVNGFVKGSIKNNTEDIMNDVYLKIDMYSERDVNLGTKYVKIDNLQSKGSQEFEMWYEFTDVNYVILTLTDNAPNVSESEFSSSQLTAYLLFGKLMFFYFFV